METLKIDIDIKNFEKVSSILVNRVGFVCSKLDVKLLDIRVASTMKGYHIYIDVEGSYSVFDITFLQMAMGSDYKRECFNYFRYSKMPPEQLNKEWNTLFKVKMDGNGKILSKEQDEPILGPLLLKLIRERLV